MLCPSIGGREGLRSKFKHCLPDRQKPEALLPGIVGARGSSGPREHRHACRHASCDFTLPQQESVSSALQQLELILSQPAYCSTVKAKHVKPTYLVSYGVPGTVYQVRCTRYGVPRTVYQVRCTRHGVPGTVYQVRCTQSPHARSACSTSL